MLNHKNYKVRIVSLSKLEPFARLPGVLEDVVKILKRHKDEQLKDSELAEVRTAAALWIGAAIKEGDEAKRGIPALKFALSKDPSADVQAAAARALGAFGPDAETAVDELKAALLSKHQGLRTAAAETLKELKDRAESALPEVLAALQKYKGKNAEPLDRIYMVQIAARIPDKAIATVPVLSEIVADTNDEPKVRKAAAEGLGRLGAAAGSASANLEKVFRDKKASVPLRRAALQAFHAVGAGTKTAWPVLKEMLQEPDASLRLNAVRVAGPLGKDVPAVVAELTTLCVKDADVEVRVAAVQELGRLGSVASEAVPVLKRLSSEGRPAVREAAKEALKQIQAP